MFEYETDADAFTDIADIITDIITELNGGRVLPVIEETHEYDLDAEVSL